jgi:Cu/Zn superoxide dismutase
MDHAERWSIARVDSTQQGLLQPPTLEEFLHLKTRNEVIDESILVHLMHDNPAPLRMSWP